MASDEIRLGVYNKTCQRNINVTLIAISLIEPSLYMHLKLNVIDFLKNCLSHKKLACGMKYSSL